jgi:16S rRNA (cytosine967-C5)-methyltransferase
MRYIWQHVNTIIHTYQGQIPLSRFLKSHFREHKKLGSRDRKIIATMLYSWYRCSKALPAELSFEDKVKSCIFICETALPQLLQFLPEQWQQRKGASTEKRIAFLKDEGINFELERLASFPLHLSEGITPDDWLESMLQQPDLFIRIRKNKDKIEKRLQENQVAYREVTERCLALPNGSAADQLLQEEDYVVQDLSSQSTANYFSVNKNESWWDCCCGAGGKSLLLKDLQPAVELTVSDKRAGILHNLGDRFKRYQLRQPKQLVLDVTDAEAIKQQLNGQKFDHIICDVPCTGSGTWARTPEQLYFSKEETLQQYSQRQKKIAANVVPYLKEGGTLYYITCSVFKEENEDVVKSLLEQSDLRGESQQLINGLANKADCMFIAVLKR